MKKEDILWKKDELLLALNLYSKLAFGQLDQRNPNVISLSKILGRTPSSIALKLVNFASLDPRLTQKGMDKTSKLDKIVWAEYMHNWSDLFFEGEQLLARKTNTTIEKMYDVNLDKYDKTEGKEVDRMVRVRVDQSGFRGAVLTNFNNKCCITGIDMIDLLVASHIVPWSVDKENRLTPTNGLALNALHDKAFDKHFITITENLTIKISSNFYKHKNVESIKQNFIDYDGKQLIYPKKFYPNIEFLKIHNDSFKA